VVSTPGLQASASPEPRTAPIPILTPTGTLPGEMKQVSVLFCDIVNSTPLTERLVPERMRDLVHGFLQTSTAEVRRYDGTAPQFTGDGFMALFGAPLTHEDHVRRALLAAVAIQRALGENNEAASRPFLIACSGAVRRSRDCFGRGPIHRSYRPAYHCFIDDQKPLGRARADRSEDAASVG
jgi:class 3 adenylate cyclase